MVILYVGKPPLPQRASWVVSSINKKHPELIKPYLSKIINSLANFKTEGIKRNLTLALVSHQIQKSLQAKLITFCFAA